MWMAHCLSERGSTLRFARSKLILLGIIEYLLVHHSEFLCPIPFCVIIIWITDSSVGYSVSSSGHSVLASPLIISIVAAQRCRHILLSNLFEKVVLLPFRHNLCAGYAVAVGILEVEPHTQLQIAGGRAGAVVTPSKHGRRHFISVAFLIFQRHCLAVPVLISYPYMPAPDYVAVARAVGKSNHRIPLGNGVLIHIKRDKITII